MNACQRVVLLKDKAGSLFATTDDELPEMFDGRDIPPVNLLLESSDVVRPVVPVDLVVPDVLREQPGFLDGLVSHRHGHFSPIGNGPVLPCDYRNRSGRQVKNDDNAHWLEPFAQMARVLKDGGACLNFYAWNKVA